MRLRLLMLAGMVLALGCIPLTTPGATGNNVYVGNYYFTPVIDSTTAGQNDSATITFRWADSLTGVGHRIVWDSMKGGMGNDSVVPGPNPLQFDGTYDVVLASGRYYYHCAVHGGADNAFGMDGQIVVLPFGFTPPQTALRLQDSHPTPVLPLITQPSREALRESPQRAARRSQPATS
jgi:plastocyanin